MPQPRGPWDKFQLVAGGIRKASGQPETLSCPAAQAIAPETEALLRALQDKTGQTKAMKKGRGFLPSLENKLRQQKLVAEHLRR
jgi:hypothetical protein